MKDETRGVAIEEICWIEAKDVFVFWQTTIVNLKKQKV